MDYRHCALSAAIALATPLSACGGGAEAVDAMPRADARDISCAVENAEIGRCSVANSDEECTGVPGEERVFAPLSDGDPVNLVVGPQGAPMFVFALRSSDLDPGEPESPGSPENPDVNIVIRVDAGSGDMAHFRARPAFTADEMAPGMLTAAGLFVVVDVNASELDGRSLLAAAHVEDRDGVEKCAQLDFVARTPPPGPGPGL